MRRNRRHRRRFELTEHFRDKYRARFGAEPATEAIENVVKTSALAQKSMPMKYEDGRPWNALGIYVNFRAGMVVMVDGTGGMDWAVTLLTEEDQG